MLRFVPWSEVGTITVSPGDNVVEVGAFELAEGADTLWVRMTNTGDPGPWPWSYGILSFQTDEGQPLGSIKAYNSFDGEVFKLGVGLPPSVRAGVLTFEPRGFNMAWIKQGNPWTLKFEAQSGGPNLTSSMWERDPANGVITPKVSGDNLDMTPGWIKAKELILTDGSGAPVEKVVPGYQQGLWIPTMDHGTNTDNPGVNVWFRVGNFVTLTAWLNNWTDTTTQSALTVQGLPYSFDFNQVGGSAVSTRSGVAVHTAFMPSSSQGIIFYQSASSTGDSWDSLFYSDTNAATQIRFQVTYLTDNRDWEPINNATIEE